MLRQQLDLGDAPFGRGSDHFEQADRASIQFDDLGAVKVAAHTRLDEFGGLIDACGRVHRPHRLAAQFQ
jgi:hypothetical protein